jgi:hypothetical protein
VSLSFNRWGTNDFLWNRVHEARVKRLTCTM